MARFPIVYVRGYAGTTAGINSQVDDPLYGFNKGATHVRANGDGEPMFYQFEGPLLRLVGEHGYKLYVHGDQRQLLRQQWSTPPDPASIWVHRFYDSAATTFSAPKKEGLLRRIGEKLHYDVSADGFNIEDAAADLYELIELICAKTGAPRVYVVAHSMGGLIARCMIQKVCAMPKVNEDGRKTPRKPAKEIVDKLFTFGTPHGGIVTDIGPVNTAMELFGPGGADIFSPPKMYGYLTPGKTFGDVPPADDNWDPREVPVQDFDPEDIFCIVGTDPADYGLSRVAVGPKSDGLVRIENAYVKGAHRAYIYKSHSGTYGEVNSEEGYQNLQRFLFGRWEVAVSFAGLPSALPADGTTWQADMRLAVRGMPVVMSEQQAAHWCPIILNKELRPHADEADAPVPIVSTFLFEAEPPPEGAATSEGDTLSRYAITLRVYKVVESHGAFDFHRHLEQVSEWADSLIVDVGPTAPQAGLGAWTGWNAEIPGTIDSVPRMPNRLTLNPEPHTGGLIGSVELPASARALPIFGPNASLQITVRDRTKPATRAEPAV